MKDIPRWLALWCALCHAALTAQVSEDFLSRYPEHMDRLFGELDPAQPAMAPIIEAWRAGRQVEAANALSRYYAEKPFPSDLLEPLLIPANLIEQAERSLQLEFFLLDRWEAQERRPDGGPDWEDRGSRGDKERAWMLNRHAILTVLQEAYAREGDPRFREQFNFLWRDWILNSPYPARLTFSPQWRPLEVARRVLNSWIHVFYGESLLDAETRLLVLSSVLDHADSLRHHASFWGGNHLITEKLALLSLAIAWPEFRWAEPYGDYAVERVSEEFIKQTYPDGSYKELSNHYQRVVLLNAQHFLRLLAHLDGEFRERPVYRRIEAMWDFFAGSMRPNGNGPVNNASDREHNAGQLLEVWEFYNRRDWLGMATNGRQGLLPEGAPSRFYPWAGQAFLRNHWGPAGDWVYFDAGPYGTAHQHVDRFHVSASLNGKSILMDSGRFTYQPGIWKDYFRGPESHSLILLDGREADQAPREVNQPLPVAFEDREAAVFTAAVTQFPQTGPAGILSSPTRWTRAILYDKRGFVLILDHLVGFADQHLEARWHFHPEVGLEEARQILQLLHPGDTLQRHLQKGEETPPLGAFYSPDYGRREAAFLMRYEGILRKPTTFIWALRDPEDPALQVKVLSEPGAPVLELSIHLDGFAPTEARIRLYPEPEWIDYR